MTNRIVGRMQSALGVHTGLIRWNAEYAEYTAEIVGQPPSAMYFTDDRQDADDTLRCMLAALEAGHNRGVA